MSQPLGTARQKRQPAFCEVGGGATPTRCRILYVVGQLHTGGLERQLYYLVRSLDRDKYQPAVAVWNYRDSDVHVAPIQALRIPIYAVPRGSSRLTKLRAFRELVEHLQPEVIHSYSFHTNVAASWGARGSRAVAVGSVRGDFEWEKNGAGPVLGRLCARWPGFQIFNSGAAASLAARSQSFFAPRQRDVVRNGLDLERFQSMPVSPGRRRIVGLGYLLPVKRWDRVLRAASELRQRGLDFAIDIYGGGPLREELEDQSRALDVADRVALRDHVDDVPGVLAASAFVVLTSDKEGYPNAVMEAMACGRPVVASRVGDLPSLVDDGVTGFLVEPNEESTLADRMATLLTDVALCERMGRAARLKAEREFGLDRLVSLTMAAYESAGWKRDGTTAEPGPIATQPQSA